jgi:NADH-quinone oxidoreductase subunit N
MIAAQDLQQLFQPLTDPNASVACAPILALGVGVLLFLLCDMIDALRPARALAFVGTLVVALFYELRILGMEEVPGAVLDGTLVANRTTALFGCLFLLGTLLAWTYSLGYYRQSKPFKPEHDALMLTAPAGMMLMVGANDLIVFFIGLELLSLPLYALAAFRRARAASVEAGLKYFLLGAFSSAVLLYGSALLYTSAGTVSLPGLVAADLDSRLALAGLALVAASLFFKVSVFPFHLWVPDVYQGSPTPVTALMATGTKAAAFGFLVVQVMPLLPAQGAAIVAVLALVTMALGNLGALVQEDLKRMLAYSGIAHAGTLLLVLAGGMAGADGASASRAVLYYMGAYLFTATGAFGLIGLLEADGERFTRLASLRGLARSRPGVAAALSLFMLSLGGIPATGGFLGKWFAFSVLVEADMIGTAILGALLSVVALGYYLRVIVVLYMQPADEGQAAPTTTRFATAGLATLVCAVFVLLTGLLPGLFLGPLEG